MDKRPVISFLIGSGFSIPEGIPGVQAINERLSKIDESEIMIHSDQSAFFLNGQVDNNRWSRWNERMFVQHFLEFYNGSVLKKGEAFHYETFYDFYNGYLHDYQNKDLIESFYEQFTSQYIKGDNTRDCLNRVLDFNRTFNQLLASLLYKPEHIEDASALNYPPYDAFVEFLQNLMAIGDIKFHSLNHDLFFDFLGKHYSGLSSDFSDGFELEGSPFYGIIHHHVDVPTRHGSGISKSYYVKLARFTGRFDTRLSFYKLHGSIFNTIVYIGGPTLQPVLIKDDYGIDGYVQEVKQRGGKYAFSFLHNEVSPDYLTGTTNKMRHYTGNAHYSALFRHFENNLQTSSLLVVTGYGFQDPGINDYLETHYLKRKLPMVMIDPVKPKTDLLDRYGALFIQRSIAQVSEKEFQEIIDKYLRAGEKKTARK